MSFYNHNSTQRYYGEVDNLTLALHSNTRYFIKVEIYKNISTSS